MSDAQTVTRALNFLGIDETTVEVLALLPLIQVAWADGEVQEQERDAILAIARDRYHLGEDGAHLLEGWLSHPPSAAYLERGRQLLVALAHQRDDFDLEPEHLDDVVAFSKQVAQAAGGFLGFRSVSAEEAEAIEAIAAALSVSHSEPVAITHFDEDVEDADTDVHDAATMDAIREAAGIVPDDRVLEGILVAELVHEGEVGPVRFAMDAGGLTIGRSRANAVQVHHDGEISRFHCKILTEDGRFYVEDNGTTNGTWVNGERVSRRRLFGKEQIGVGSARFVFQVH